MDDYSTLPSIQRKLCENLLAHANLNCRQTMLLHVFLLLRHLRISSHPTCYPVFSCFCTTINDIET